MSVLLYNRHFFSIKRRRHNNTMKENFEKLSI